MEVNPRTVAGVKIVRVMVIGWVLSAVVSLLGICILALVCCLIGEGQNRMEISVYVIVVIAVILGGFYVGHKMGVRRFLWGMALGGIYCVGLCLLAWVSGGVNTSEWHFSVPFILLCLGSGMFGGMIG